MPLKFKLDSLDGLDDATKAMYEKKGDKFVLKVEGIEDGDVAGLKTQVETLLGEVKTLKGKLGEKDAAEAAAREAERVAREEAAAKKGDIETLRKSADERVAKAISDTEAKYKPTVEKLQKTVQTLLVDNVAQGLATKIGLKGSEKLLIPHIQQRLAVEERDGEFATVVRGADGKASALSLDDLEKEFVGNEAFAPVIAGSKANGGGAGGGQNKGGGASGAKQIKRSDFDVLSPGDQASRMKDGFKVVD